MTPEEEALCLKWAKHMEAEDQRNRDKARRTAAMLNWWLDHHFEKQLRSAAIAEVHSVRETC